ncbi:MAG: hypothetical protein ACE5KT_12030 [Methanosarcinales archaeon]
MRFEILPDALIKAGIKPGTYLAKIIGHDFALVFGKEARDGEIEIKYIKDKEKHYLEIPHHIVERIKLNETVGSFIDALYYKDGQVEVII